jgi:ABC-type transporter Mla maintaining outer membrane lipid asymmetry permease subunit MlaE
MSALGATLELAARSAVGWGALRRRAVRNALAAAFAAGLGRTLATAAIVAVLLGVILLREVLPLVPWFGRRSDDLAGMLLFAVQHLGDVVAGILVAGQAGLMATHELGQVRAKQRDASVRAAGIDPVEYFVLPRVWALAVLYVFILLFFKVLAVASGAVAAWVLDGRWLGPEIGAVLLGRAPAIFAGYAVNSLLALLLASVCCAPPLELPGVFRRSLILIFAAKLLTLRFDALF